LLSICTENGIWRVMFQPRSVPVLSDVFVTILFSVIIQLQMADFDYVTIAFNER